MRYLITLICFFLCNVSFGQVVIGGVVKSATSGEPIDGANVMLQKMGEQGILAYAMSNQKGEFTLKTDTKVDSLTVVISGVGIEMYKRTSSQLRRSNSMCVKQSCRTPLDLMDDSVLQQSDN